MNNNNSLIFLVIGIVILHFLLGIGWVFYKIMHGESKQDVKKNDSDSIGDN